MQIKKNGSVPFSLRQRDLDLKELIESLPSQDGSEVLRELIRDGLAYQRYAKQGVVPETRLSSMIQYMDLGEVITPKEQALDSEAPVQSPFPLLMPLHGPVPEPEPEKEDPKPEPEPEEETDHIEVYDITDDTDPNNFFATPSDKDVY